MPQKFFNNSIECNFIKQLLRKTPVPTIRTAVDGRTICKGFCYLYEGQIIKCTKTGVLGGGAEYSVIYSTKNDINNPTLYHTYISRFNYYDSDTHRQLGEYLRFYRDTTGVDLMPFYNCFNYEFAEDFHLTSNGTGYAFGPDKDYKYVAVPVRIGATYTIAVDCPFEVRMRPMFYSSFGLVETMVSTASYQDLNALFTFNYSYSTFEQPVSSGGVQKETVTGASVIRLPFVSFKKPFVFKVDLNFAGQGTVDSEKLLECAYSNERFLRLIIRLPISNKSSLVVLEGDYSDTHIKEFDAQKLGSADTSVKNSAMLGDLSLLMFSDGNSYAFSDRLIEYLLLNAITSQEEIVGNISYAQRNAFSTLPQGSFDGIWDDKIRVALWNKYRGRIQKDNIPHHEKKMVDMNGFVDKSMEKIMV